MVKVNLKINEIIFKHFKEDRATMAELAARSLHDRKVVGSNPTGSNSDRQVRITRIDGYIHYEK